MMHESPKSRYPQKDERFGLEELRWIHYQRDTAAANAAMINAVWDNVEFLRALPGERRQAFANYPESVRCPGKKMDRP